MAEYVIDLSGVEVKTIKEAHGIETIEALWGLPVRERIVRCRDCKHSHKDGTLCNFFASWVPIAGGDEYECMPVEVEPDGFCKWGEPKEDK